MTNSQTRREPGWIPDVSTFGARLALLRQAMGWTNIKEAAVACAIAPQTWRYWESGKFEPRGLVNACMKIAGVTGVDYRWLALGPDALAASAEERPADVTAGYPLSERVVTVSMPDRAIDRPRFGPGLRTQPLPSANISRRTPV